MPTGTHASPSSKPAACSAEWPKRIAPLRIWCRCRASVEIPSPKMAITSPALSLGTHASMASRLRSLARSRF